jgi:hypothetical protein
MSPCAERTWRKKRKQGKKATVYARALNQTTADWHTRLVTLSATKGLLERCFASLCMTGPYSPASKRGPQSCGLIEEQLIVPFPFRKAKNLRNLAGASLLERTTYRFFTGLADATESLLIVCQDSHEGGIF